MSCSIQFLLMFYLKCSFKCWNSVEEMKYFYKYVYKGYDSAKVIISDGNQETLDEIKEYLNMRYLSSAEAMCRIFSYSISISMVNVVELSIHFPNKQYINFRENKTLDNAHDTMLLTWFKLNCVTVSDES